MYTERIIDTGERQLVRISDGAVIPRDEGNSDYRDVLSWVLDGNRLSVVAPDLAAVKARRLRQLDSDAEAVRARYLTLSPGMAMTYQEKFAQAQAVLAMGEPAARELTAAEREAQFPTLSASVGIEEDSLWDCAQLVLGKYAQFAQLSLIIERIRLAGKKAISAAATVDAANAAYGAVTWPPT